MDGSDSAPPIAIFAWISILFDVLSEGRHLKSSLGPAPSALIRTSSGTISLRQYGGNPWIFWSGIPIRQNQSCFRSRFCRLPVWLPRLTGMFHRRLRALQPAAIGTMPGAYQVSPGERVAGRHDLARRRRLFERNKGWGERRLRFPNQSTPCQRLPPEPRAHPDGSPPSIVR